LKLRPIETERDVARALKKLAVESSIAESVGPASRNRLLLD
jgi:hypothetical protein